MFKLAPLGHGPLFEITSRNLCEPSFSDVVLRQIICQASPLAQILTLTQQPIEHPGHDRMNRNVPDLLFNPFRHSLLLDPLCDLHLWNFLFFHLFLHMLEFYDILCRLTCKRSVMAPLPRLQDASSWPSVKLASTTSTTWPEDNGVKP